MWQSAHTLKNDNDSKRHETQQPTTKQHPPTIGEVALSTSNLISNELRKQIALSKASALARRAALATTTAATTTAAAQARLTPQMRDLVAHNKTTALAKRQTQKDARKPKWNITTATNSHFGTHTNPNTNDAKLTQLQSARVACSLAAAATRDTKTTAASRPNHNDTDKNKKHTTGLQG